MIEYKNNFCYTDNVDIKYQENGEYKMSYMMAVKAKDNVILVTDSRVSYKNGYSDDNKKIYKSSDNKRAFGIIGPQSFIHNDIKYNTNEFLTEKLFNNLTVEECLFYKIGKEYFKDILKLYFPDSVLTIFEITSTTIKAYDYIIKNDELHTKYNLICAYAGDFPNELVKQLIGDTKNFSYTSCDLLQEKIVKIMDTIIETSEKCSKINNKVSTIGGEIQSIIL